MMMMMMMMMIDDDGDDGDNADSLTRYLLACKKNTTICVVWYVIWSNWALSVVTSMTAVTSSDDTQC